MAHTSLNKNILLTINTLLTYIIKQMLTKKEVLESINALPPTFEAEDAIDKIVLLEKVRIGLEQSEAGKVVSMGDAKIRLKKWLR